MNGRFLAILPLVFGLALHAQEPKKGGGDYLFPVGEGKWKGAAQETPAGGGKPSEIVWSFATSKAVRAQDILHDWSKYTGLAMTLVCNKASESKLYLIVPSEDKSKHGGDYYALRMKLDFEGEKSFVIPFDELGKARFPIGLHKIDSFSFHNSWNPRDSVDKDVVLKIRDLRLVAETNLSRTGPRISDSQLFGEMLDLSYPGLEKVKAAVEKDDFTTARHELAEHVRHRKKPLWFVDPRDRPTAGMAPQTRRSEKGVGGRYRANIKVDWTGWKKIALKKSDLKTQGKPIGWNWISRLSLTARPAGDTSGITLYLDDCRLTGPGGEHRLGDFECEATGWTDLFRSEEQAHSGKASGKWWFLDIHRSVTCGKFPGDWSRYDTLELWIHTEKPADLDITVSVDSYLPKTEYADQILTHRFHIGSFRKNVFDFGERIDWSSNAMTEGESRTIEWNAQLNRHFHFTYLVRAYWQTGDEKYARELAQEMNAWIEDCPLLLVSSGNSPYHYAWETLNTAVRFQKSWPNAIYRCILSPSFTDDIIVNIVKSAAEHAKHLIKNPTAGNWFTAESLGIYTVGVLFPEYKAAKEWRRLGITRLYDQLNEEIYPDGLEYEVALGYNCWVLSEYVRLLEVAKLNGLSDEVPADYKSRIEKMFNYLMYDAMPDGVAFGLNDSGNANVKTRLLEGYRYFPRRSDFVYAVSAGKQGTRPPQDSIAMPYSGHYIMRSGWDANARILHYDAGLFGRSHQHEDKLTAAMCAYGKLLLPDSGNYMYDRSRWRVYVLLTRAHNTVLVDGMDQFRRRSPDLRTWPQPWDAPSPPTDTRWTSVHGLDYAVGFYKHKYREYLDYQNPIKDPKILETVQHARRILFVKPDFWIVHDTLTADDDAEHTCDVLFHINADEAAVDPKNNAVVSSSKNEADVAIVPLNVDGLTASVVKGKAEPPVQGWTKCVRKKRDPKYPMLAIPTAIFSKTWRKNTDVVTVLYPFPADGQSPVKTVEPLEVQGAVAARVTLADGAVHVYLCSSKPRETIEVGGVRTDGEAVDVCAQPGEKLRLLLVNGTSLSAGNASVALGEKGSVSVTGYADGVSVLGVDVAADCSVRIPGLAGQGAVEVHRIDNDLKRVEKIDATMADGVLKLRTEIGAAYEITSPGTKALRAIVQERLTKTDSADLKLDYPVKPVAKLPPAKGVKVVVQAEDLCGQEGGEVTVTDKKVAADGKAFFHWDNPGHALDYKFSVPQDGEYYITLKYCSESDAPVRALIVDKAFPAECMKRLRMASTGGWSNDHDDWQLLTVTDPKTKKPFPFDLRKGEHTLRLVNVQDSVNLDYIVVHSPDVEVVK